MKQALLNFSTKDNVPNLNYATKCTHNEATYYHHIGMLHHINLVVHEVLDLNV